MFHATGAYGFHGLSLFIGVFLEEGLPSRVLDGLGLFPFGILVRVKYG
jgi:hypothetical protein